MSATADSTEAPVPASLAGIPLTEWAFACRIWIAMMLALATAFWLQLDNASSAAVTVAILAQPRRGQAFRKAVFRIGATVVGCTAAIVITGVFSQSRDLFILAYAAWMALAVYIASCYDGTRAYGAVLSGYTVAVIAVINVDNPQTVFNAAMARLAVVSLGIASIALINDVFAAPDVYPTVRQRLRAALAETRAIVASHLSGTGPGPEGTVQLVTKIVGLRLDVQTLPAESATGAPRAAAAHSACVAMIGALSLARAFAAMSRTNPDLCTDEILAALEASDHAALDTMLREELASPEASPRRIMILRCAEQLAKERQLAASELEAMEAGRWPSRQIKSLPIHRDREAALRKAFHVFIGIVVAGAAFVLSSWPLTAVSFAQVGIFAGLGATMPDIRAFIRGAMVAIPCAALVAGITEFVFLDGADAFPLLAIGMAPAIFLATLLSIRPKTAGLGFLMLVYVPVIFPPSNPQSYDPQSFLFTAILSSAGVLLFGLILFALPATTDKERRRWLVNRVRRDVLAAAAGQIHRTPEEMRYLGADRMVALSNMKIGTPAGQAWRLGYLLSLSVATLVAVRANDALDELPKTMPGAREARAALAELDPPALDAAALALARADCPDGCFEARVSVVADIAFIAGLSRVRGPRFRHLRSALSP